MSPATRDRYFLHPAAKAKLIYLSSIDRKGKRDERSHFQNTPSAIALFAKVPKPGRVKTRLGKCIGDKWACTFYQAFVQDTLLLLGRFKGARYLFLAGSSRERTVFTDELKLPQGTGIEQQRRGNLGDRLAHAFLKLLLKHSRVVLLGTDSPTLPDLYVRQALGELQVCDSVLGPSPDGGYYLMGLRRSSAVLFKGIRWGTHHTYQDTLKNLMDFRFSCSVLAPWPDIDRPSDLVALRRDLSREPALRRRAPNTARVLRQWETEPFAGRKSLPD